MNNVSFASSGDFAKTPLQPWRRFFRDKRGGTATTFALALTPLLLMGGLAIDYGNKTRGDADLRHAADAAALDAVINAKNNVQGGMAFENAKALAEQAAKGAFAANASSYKDLASRPLKLEITQSGAFISAAVVYDVDLPGIFSPLIGRKTLRMSNENSPSVAKAQTNMFANYFLMLDMSASMALPSTAGEQERYLKHPLNTDLKAENGGNTCVFACHGKKSAGTGSPKNEWNGYRITRKYQAKTIADLDSLAGSVNYCDKPGQDACIQLRTDAMSYAVKNFLSTVKKTATDNKLSDQFQVGVYPFIVHLATFKKLTADTDSIAEVTDQIPSLLDTHDPNNVRGSNPTQVMTDMGSGGTHFDKAIPEMQKIIETTPHKGDGSEKHKRKSFVFLITDGMRDPQIFYLPPGAKAYTPSGSNGGDHSKPIDQSYCTDMKNNNITLGILYLPYIKLVETSYSYSESVWANKAIPLLEPALQKCASPGYFFKAESPTDVDNMLKKMFYQSVTKTVLSN